MYVRFNGVYSVSWGESKVMNLIYEEGKETPGNTHFIPAGNESTAVLKKWCHLQGMGTWTGVRFLSRMGFSWTPPSLFNSLFCDDD